LDEAFVVYYWVVNYDEILDEPFVVYYWVVKYDQIWMIGAMIFQPYIHQATTQVWMFGSQNLGWWRSTFFCCPASYTPRNSSATTL